MCKSSYLKMCEPLRVQIYKNTLVASKQLVVAIIVTVDILIFVIYYLFTLVLVVSIA